MDNQTLARLIKQNKSPSVIDVRSGFEFRSGHIPGATHLPLVKVLIRLAKLPADKNSDYVVVCEHGPRAQMVQMMMARKGYRSVQLLKGHMHSWRNRGLPLEK